MDLNADVSEGFGVYKPFEAAGLYDVITSANVACGFHAGDPLGILRTIALCKEKGVKVGAHPGYRDLVGFGRRALALSEEEAIGDLVYQVGALQGLARYCQYQVDYVKLHGAWYNSAMTGIHAHALVQALKGLEGSLGWLAQGGTDFFNVCKGEQVAVYAEVFADRNYMDNGALVPRTHSDALIHDPSKALDHVKRMVLDGKVKTISGHLIPIQVDSICIHGDNPSAVTFAEQLRYSLEAEGVVFKGFTDDKGRNPQCK